jgi:hypothetical protein
MTIRLSQDGGQAWPVARLLYPGSSAYSCLTTLPDGSIGLLFERDNYTRITFARVEEGWLLNHGLDSDGDGLPDAWESLHGLNPNDPSDAHLDADGDGASNLEEFLAGTDPAATASRLRATGFEFASAANDENRFLFRFAAVPARAYQIEASADLLAWQAIHALTANRPRMELEVTMPASVPRQFLRVRALP